MQSSSSDPRLSTSPHVWLSLRNNTGCLMSKVCMKKVINLPSVCTCHLMPFSVQTCLPLAMPPLQPAEAEPQAASGSCRSLLWTAGCMQLRPACIPLLLLKAWSLIVGSSNP